MMMLVQAQLSTDRGDEDESLIAAAAQGDRGAFGELYSRYARMVHGILLARVPAGDAEDLVQEVFMSAMRQLRVLRTAAAFRGWLAAIARNRAIDYFRAWKRSRLFPRRTARR
jgi:RNA polymerase sigma-70 factor (ECF subfamily)